MGLFQFASDDTFQRTFNQLWGTSAPNKRFFQQAVHEEAAAILKEQNGLEKLFQYAHLFDEAGVFMGRVWENVRKLDPSLVRGTLQAGGVIAAVETMSNLRILAIARGTYEHPEMSAQEANNFLTKVMALNLDLLLLKETEENRVMQLFKDKQLADILGFISNYCFSPLVFQSLYQEVDNLAIQRPIVTDKILKVIASARKLAGCLADVDSGWVQYEKAVYYPSDLAAASKTSYENNLKASNDALLVKEAEQLHDSMDRTGLVSLFHANYLTYINKKNPVLLQNLLTVNETARENLRLHFQFVSALISSAINVKTRRSIYGLMRLLQRDIFTNEFISEFEKLMVVPIHKKIEHRLAEVTGLTKIAALRSHVISGMISILGQPLGIGQGFNPTCQSTRTLSYWSQKEPVMLLKMFNHFMEHGNITIDFEGKSISSNMLSHVPLEDEDHIDIISLLIIPHLDAIYLEMLNAARDRGQDLHKWINPALHIKGIWTEFSDVYSDSDFTFRFYRHYHPVNNPIVNEGLPQPAGITIYNQSGLALGAHAVLIQRVCPDPFGCIRIYFYNPNNDSLQVWGNSIRTSITGNGELEGESSLPFEDFLYCLYAFHFQ